MGAGLTTFRAILVAEIAASVAADAGAATAKRSRGSVLIDDYLAASPQAAELVRLWEPKYKVRCRLSPLAQASLKAHA